MTKDDAENVLYRIREEGFDYTFDGYDTWGEIRDEKFHNLRLNYLAAKETLYQYLKEQQHGPNN
jgi:hypothetical protein